MTLDDHRRTQDASTARFKATLKGEGFVRGLRFRPAGFRALYPSSMRDLADRVAPASTVFGTFMVAPTSFADTPAALCGYVRALRQSAPRPVDDDTIAKVNDLVALAQRDGSILRVDGLADRAGVSPRSLHRLFADYVGVSSKWVVRRARVQDAAERVARGEPVAWADVAASLGYSDQAHLIRDFSAQVGCTPAAYAARCAARAPT